MVKGVAFKDRRQKYCSIRGLKFALESIMITIIIYKLSY